MTERMDGTFISDWRCSPDTGYKAPAMPQRPNVRRKQKTRRSRKLAAWREKQEQAQSASKAKSSDKE